MAASAGLHARPIFLWLSGQQIRHLEKIVRFRRLGIS